MKLTKSQISAINKIFEVLELGKVEDIKILDSSQNTVYKVTTDKKEYVLKEYSKDAIRNEYELNKRKRQISVSEKYSQNGIPTILPLKFNNRNFIKYKNRYYLVYDYLDYQTLTPSELDVKKIRKIANVLAITHNLNIKSDLPCQYKTIKIDLNKYLKKYKRLDEKLYKTLYDNYFTLENLILNCNNSIKYVKTHLCVSHNDLKLKNILWKKDFMYLIDFDACAMTNPATALVECAFSLTKKGNKVDTELYKEFIKTYLKKYGQLTTSFKDAQQVAMNGKLQWLEYLMGKCSKKDVQAIEDTISMIKELTLYVRKMDELNDIYLSLVK